MRGTCCYNYVDSDLSINNYLCLQLPLQASLLTYNPTILLTYNTTILYIYILAKNILICHISNLFFRPYRFRSGFESESVHRRNVTGQGRQLFKVTF